MDALVNHLEQHTPATAQVTVYPGEKGKPYSARQHSAAMDLARTALGDAWGTAAVDTGLGGSIPFIADLLEVFPDADVLVTGVEDPESGLMAWTNPSISTSSHACASPRRCCCAVPAASPARE